MARFAANVLRLGLGNVATQLISVAAIPVITRLYGPEQYGIFSIYFAATALAYPVSTLQYHSALMLPREWKQAANLLVMALISVTCVALLLIPLGILLAQFLGIRGFSGLGGYVWLIPLGVLIQGVGEALDFWSLRLGAYGKMAISRTLGTAVDRGLAVGAGIMYSPGAIYLIFSRIIGPLINTLFLTRAVLWGTLKKIRSAISLTELYELAKRYRRFPLYSTWATFLQTASFEFPVILLAAMFSPAIAGLYAMASRLIRLPAALISDAIGRTYLQRVCHRRSEGLPIGAETVELFGYALYASMFPAIILLFFAREIVSGILGEGWAEAGTFLAILIVIFIGLITNRVLAVLYDVLERQRQRLLYDMGAFSSRVTFLILGAYVGGTPRAAVIGLAVASAGAYIAGWIYLFGLIGVTASRLAKFTSRRVITMMPLFIGVAGSKAMPTGHVFAQLMIITISIFLQIAVILVTDQALRSRVASVLNFAGPGAKTSN